MTHLCLVIILQGGFLTTPLDTQTDKLGVPLVKIMSFSLVPIHIEGNIALNHVLSRKVVLPSHV